MVLELKTKSRRSIPLGKRDLLALNALDRTNLKRIDQNVALLTQLHEAMKRKTVLKPVLRVIRAGILSEIGKQMQILLVDVPEHGIRARAAPMDFAAMEKVLQGLGLECSERFRFQSFAQLRRLCEGFRFPQGKIILETGYKSTAEEIILISLTRLAYPSRWSDLSERFPGRHRRFLQLAFYWFLDFLIANWGYLILNNRQYWKPHLAASCEAIRMKLQELNHEPWRLYFPPAGQPGGFDVALFIDNTMLAFDRPGGVEAEGPAAARCLLELQEAWYTGWKKICGMKFQSVMLANGMDFEVYGGCRFPLFSTLSHPFPHPSPLCL